MIPAYKVGSMNFDRYDNRIIRKYAGSKRPPQIWPEDWQKMTPKEKTAELLQYQKSIDPTLTGGASSSNSPAMPSSVTSLSRRGARPGSIKTSCCRRIIEWCCGENSLIGGVKLNNKDTTCITTRITEDIDASSPSGLAYAKNAYYRNRKIPNTLFASIPCTGGTAWNSVNKNNPDGEARIEEHRKLFDKIWDNFVKLVKYCDDNTDDIPVSVVIEWPKGCSYWKNPKVVAFMEFRGLLKVSFDGCYFGLQSSTNHLPIRKPWTFATSNAEIYDAFHGCKCPGHEHHQQCEGSHTKSTENYTAAMVSKLH